MTRGTYPDNVYPDVGNHQNGAPLKVLLFILVCWILGRIIWENMIPANAPPVGKAGMAVDELVSIPPGAFVAEQRSLIADQNGNTSSFGRTSIEYSHQAYAGLARSELSTPLAIIDTNNQESRKILSSSFVLMEEQKRQAIDYDAGRGARSKTHLAMADTERNYSTTRRLSGYFWIFARPNEDGASSGGLAASGQIAGGQFGAQYGGSQLGAILTYRLTGQSDRGAALFGRVTSAINASGQEEAALGVRIKPLPKFPLAIYVEQRLGLADGDNRGTATYLAGGFGPQEVVSGVQLETYAQAGYIFGPAESYFFDGSTTLQKNLTAGSGTKISVGGGLWTGGQKGTSRLDVGPRASFDLPIAGSRARVFVDWRQRIAGDAAPDSGVALTLTTGF